MSPVRVSFRPASATMSPAKASLMSSRLLACISSMRPTRSFLSLVELSTVRAGLDLAGIDAAEGDRADERVVHDLEGEHREGLGVVGMTHDLLAGVDVDALDAAAIDRRGQIVDDRVEQRLHALVLERRAAEDRNEGDLPDRLADQRASASRCRARRRRDRLPSPRRRARRRPRSACGDIPRPSACRSAGISSS